MGREARLSNKLTKKQDTFVKAILAGGSATQAAMSAYDVNDSRTASVIASQNLSKLSIQQALDNALRSEGLTLDVLTRNIGDLANTKPAKVSGETVLKANIELLKLQGAYPDKKTYQYQMTIQGRIKDMSYAQAKEELNKLNTSLKEFESE